MKNTRFGDPLADEKVEYGPLINEAGYRKVDQLVQGAVKAGRNVGDWRPTRAGREGILLHADSAGGLPAGHGDYPAGSVRARGSSGALRRSGQAIAYANDSEYGLTSSLYTRDLNVALHACQNLRFGETYINRENFEAMQGFHAGWRKSGIGGADGKHGLYEFTQTHVVYMQRS